MTILGATAIDMELTGGANGAIIGASNTNKLFVTLGQMIERWDVVCFDRHVRRFYHDLLGHIGRFGHFGHEYHYVRRRSKHRQQA